MATHSLFVVPTRLLIGLLLSTTLLAACDDDEDDPQPAPTTNNLVLELQHNSPHGNPIQFNDSIYANARGQNYRIGKLLYYVSNVVLTKADGSEWKEPVSYHLVKGASRINSKITLPNVPFGDYTRLTFSIGVDSAANHHGDQPGDLNPSYGMIWDWMTGYKFWVLEGDYLPAGSSTMKPLIYHVSTDSSYRTITFNLPEAATVTSAIAPDVHLEVDVNGIFGGPNRMDFTQPEQLNVQHNLALVKLVADNIKNASTTIFRVAHVHNEAH